MKTMDLRGLMEYFMKRHPSFVEKLDKEYTAHTQVDTTEIHVYYGLWKLIKCMQKLEKSGIFICDEDNGKSVGWYAMKPEYMLKTAHDVLEFHNIIHDIAVKAVSEVKP